jgi:hypothetical protein
MSTPGQVNIVKTLSKPAPGLSLFLMMRDEEYFLPFFFDHYRALGVEVFIIYDDRSGPAAFDYLMAQPDTVILQSDYHFGDPFVMESTGEARPAQNVLKERLPEIFLPNQWTVQVDADEFMILPSGYSDLNAFIEYLDDIGQPYATAPMVDFYAETLNDRNYAKTLDPFAGSPFFDAGPYYYWIGRDRPISFAAGVRARLLKRLCETHPDKVLPLYGGAFPSPAWQWKSPLLKHGSGITRVGEHRMTIAPSPDAAAVALAHFKFCPNLDEKIAVALNEGQHYASSAEYAFLKAAIDFLGEESLIARETRRFDGPKSLEEAGLLPPTPQRQ